MKVLDLFCGLKGFSQAFEERGHTIITVDILEKFNPTICKDVMELTLDDFNKYGQFDIILASPPCNCFSVASIYRHWKDGKPKDKATEDSIKLVKHTIDLIKKLNPRWYIIENPRGMLRNVIGKPDYIITQCQYGRECMKPTDLWGKLPNTFIPKSCKNKDKCHQSAPRGSRRGIQGITYKDTWSRLSTSAEVRAKIPYNLSLAICEVCEKEELR